MIVQEEFDNQALAQSEFEGYVDQLTDPAPPEIEIEALHRHC